ncbi:hypothetical protein AB0942_07340 [Streptomyces nodosus]|uniref:hypothetical protein n=1 Tax=Streptomyces nodosus TaxID=40318 RepID=UPI0034537415
MTLPDEASTAVNPQPRKSPRPREFPPPGQSFADTFRRRPARAPHGLVPGRRVWAALGSTAAVTATVALAASLAQSGALHFDDHRETAAARAVPETSRPSETPSPSPSSPSPAATSSAPAPTSKAEPEKERKVEQPPVLPPVPPEVQQTQSAGSGAPMVAEPKKTAAPETAAITVARLAAQDPGRHICYRAYIEGRGWLKPVCDGAAAGTAGAGQKIKSLNIAVSGTHGTAANAFVHNDHWKVAWNGVADGVDNYIGSTKPDYPYMLGFVINVGDSAVCQNAAVHDHGWGGLACDKPLGQAAGNYIFGGTLDDSLWLEAVRFTV